MSHAKCIVCNLNPPKYNCPQCALSTCSLECVKIHKKELNCNGVRDKTAYVPLKEFGNITLLNDYRFLEEVNRNIDNCRRNPHKRFTRYMQPLPTHLYRLKSALERRKIHLQFLPQHFTRHQENKTYLNYTTQVIQWKIDFVFPQGGSLKVTEVVDENTKLSKVLDRYLNCFTCPDLYKTDLRFYHSAGVADVELLLKAERVKEPNSFYLIDIFSTVTENLTNRVIIESPVIYVIRKAYKDEYNILDDSESIPSAPFEVLHGKKSGFFGDFNPVGYFDDLEKVEKKISQGDKAFDSILGYAATLRGQERQVATEPKDSDNSPIQKPYRRRLDIPSYDSL